MEKITDMLAGAGGNIVLAIIVSIVGYLLIKFVMKALRKLKSFEKLDQTVVRFVLNCIKWLLYRISVSIGRRAQYWMVNTIFFLHALLCRVRSHRRAHARRMLDQSWACGRRRGDAVRNLRFRVQAERHGIRRARADQGERLPREVPALRQEGDAPRRRLRCGDAQPLRPAD